MDKQLIMSKLGNLKEYYKERQSESPELNPRLRHKRNYSVFVSEHLPQQLYRQKMSLMPKFKEARIAGHKTRWATVDDKYCLYVNDRKISI